MRRFVGFFARRYDALSATARIRLPIATRQLTSYKSGSTEDNHVPSLSPSSSTTTLDDTVDFAAAVIEKEEEEEVVDVRRFMHGRRNIERRDSVNDAILTERMTFQQRLASSSSSSSTWPSSSSSSSLSSLIKDIEALGLGTKRRRYRVYHTKPRQSNNNNAFADADQTKSQNTGSAGNIWLTDWPSFDRQTHYNSTTFIPNQGTERWLRRCRLDWFFFHLVTHTISTYPPTTTQSFGCYDRIRPPSRVGQQPVARVQTRIAGDRLRRTLQQR